MNERKSRLGFGLEWVGLLALDFPIVFSVLVLAITLVFGASIPSVKFDGNVTSVIPRSSESFIAYEKQKSDFRNFSRDIAVVVRSERLASAQGLEDLRNMQLDLAITPGVSSATSIFSIPDFNPESGELLSYFPGQIEDDQQAKDLLAQLLSRFPQAKNLIATDQNVSVILVSLNLGVDTGINAEAYEAFENLAEEVEAIRPDDFEVMYAGLTPIGITVMKTLIEDQVRLTLFGLLTGALIAVVFFRSLVAALICAVPPVVTTVWSIGFFGLTGVPISYLTTILPTLALILAYADGIVLYHRWSCLNRMDGHDKERKRQNLRSAVIRVGPASALTSLTTAIALSSFGLSSSEALLEFAWLGIVLVLMAFLSVIVALPLAAEWSIRVGLAKREKERPTVATLRNRVSGFSEKSALPISIMSTVLTGLLFVPHVLLEPDYRITDYLPSKSQTYEAEEIANSVFGGRSMVFLSIPTAGEGGLALEENRDRMAEITRLLETEYGDGRVFSLDVVLRKLDEAAIQTVSERLAELPESMRRGYISRNADAMLVSIRVSSSQSIQESAEMLAELENTISQFEYSDEIVVTGFPILLAGEFTTIINELRNSLLFAALLGVCLIGLATRSLFNAAVSLIPNFLPIVIVEFMIYWNGGKIDVTEVIALTLAFGISIDNAVHIINVFDAERRSGEAYVQSLRNALSEVTPALFGCTMIICSATLVMFTSGLPILPIIGQLIIVILVVALMTNLIVLPANILSYRWLTQKS